MSQGGFDHALVVGDEVVNAHIPEDDGAAFEACEDRPPKTAAPLRRVTPALDEGLLPLVGGHRRESNQKPTGVVHVQSFDSNKLGHSPLLIPRSGFVCRRSVAA